MGANKNSGKRRKHRLQIMFFLMISALLGIAVFFIAEKAKQDKEDRDRQRELTASRIAEEEKKIKAHRDAIAAAEELSKSYDYDGAIALLKEQADYERDSEITDAITRFTASKSTLEAKDPTNVPHIFFHSLINDPERAFDESKWTSRDIAGNNAWMTTGDEFDKIIEQMYENGYVLVRMRDLVAETKDEDGTVHFRKNPSLLLPADKKPYVLSVDDLSYYHSYQDHGYGDKLVLDENGKVKVRYTDAAGNVSVGDYDVVPRLNTFLEAHPDGCYKGARGLIAMTGYNGVFGYRTDVAYKTKENLDKDQAAWLKAHPEFNYENDIAEAKVIADELKNEGWEFACHTWGHLSVGSRTLEDLMADQEKWQNTVANITGKTDTIIFAHGNDIGSWRDYDAETNEVYAYFKSMGYDFYANVDASVQNWIQIRDDYVRQGRLNCDGIQMWKIISGSAKTNVFEGMFDVASVFDKRRPTPVTAYGKE